MEIKPEIQDLIDRHQAGCVLTKNDTIELMIYALELLRFVADETQKVLDSQKTLVH